MAEDGLPLPESLISFETWRGSMLLDREVKSLQEFMKSSNPHPVKEVVRNTVNRLRKLATGSRNPTND